MDAVPTTEVDTNANHELPPPPSSVTVTVQMDGDESERRKIRNQKRNIWCHQAAESHHQQVGNSFDYSNSDLRNVINIGRDARTVIISRRKERQEEEAYSPTSNYCISDEYEWAPRKRRHMSPDPPSPRGQQRDKALQAQERF